MKKVFVAMSGGVDSSVSAAVLKKAGYDVTGVFIHVWQPDFLDCTRGDDREEAMRVAVQLDIPFLTFDLEKEYKEGVVDYMIREYKRGRTPNPDVMCNKHVKFGAFYRKAKEMGADYIATGHYARVALNSGNPSLLAGKDKNKDQSYFLWTINQEVLEHTLFPVGDYEKPEVRALAKKFDLPNALRKESQGLCFVGEFKMNEFLEHFIPQKEGDVLNEKNEIIGVHKGAFYYTMGQRHGFTITKKTPNDSPYYVINKNIEKNTLSVSQEKKSEMHIKNEIYLEDTHWISGIDPSEKEEYMVRFRYRQKLQKAYYKKKDGKEKIIFLEPQEAIARGQSLVVYRGEECLGGGVVK